MTGNETVPRKRILPPVYFLLAILAMVALHRLAPVRAWDYRPWHLAGVAVILLGLGVVLVANAEFRRHGTPVKPFEPSTTIVTTGPFRFSRNPMYLGMVGILAGIAILQGSLSPIAVIPAFGWWISIRFIRKEERGLVQQFGETYLRYKRTVRRWI